MPLIHAYGTPSATTPLGPLDIERREPGAHDVKIAIRWCGVCHSDLHTVRNEWRNTLYPSVPGHEIVGEVVAVGNAVTRFRLGETVGVGCMVDSCQHCATCAAGEEQYCENGFTGTYNGRGQVNTWGGYSEHIVVREKFVLHIHHKPELLAAVAPLLCAGITTYSPLRHWHAGPGQKVGIVGLGGLGHMGVKIAHALGAHTVLFTTSPDKIADGKRFGADEVVISKDLAQMTQHKRSFDFILDTVAAAHDLDAYLNLLGHDGTLCLLGAPPTPHPAMSSSLLVGSRRQIAGSLIGGIRETQEMLDFCAERDIVCDIEKIAMADINTAYERMLKRDVKYRFVIDMATLNQTAKAA
ncbi:MAG: NAD(P)-dependent alcohol dehydrogenase [Rhodanobacter sp.]|nr:MAG: NAD(P)-dependent alcohol dehydrogenase [Rhodanobacter sp.]TAM13613.1 MAG: NAD(P)-dependent alcohol dehydrogenase [Rhodanobacter sp.]TAM35634.1 MAG: NAD(P)-dependent alcohol dehydrogenase [Rhodanobacter sp.]